MKTILRKLFLEENMTKNMLKKYSCKAKNSMFHRLTWETIKEANAAQNLKFVTQAKLLLWKYFTRLS